MQSAALCFWLKAILLLLRNIDTEQPEETEQVLHLVLNCNKSTRARERITEGDLCPQVGRLSPDPANPLHPLRYIGPEGYVPSSATRAHTRPVQSPYESYPL